MLALKCSFILFFKLGSEKNGDKALMEIIEDSALKVRKIIVIADRSYESLISFYRSEKKDIK